MDNTQEELKEARRLAKVVSGHLKGDVGYLVNSAKEFLEKYPESDPDRGLKENINLFCAYVTQIKGFEAYDSTIDKFKEMLSDHLLTEEKRADIAIEALKEFQKEFSGTHGNHTAKGLLEMLDRHISQKGN